MSSVVQQKFGGCDAASSSAGKHEFGVFDSPAGDVERVDNRRQYGDGRAVLVIVEHGDT